MFMWPLFIRGVFGGVMVCLLLTTACTPLPETPAPLPSPTPIDLARNQPPAPLHVIAHDDLLLRAQPGNSGEATGALRAGAQAQVLTSDTRLAWLEVECSGDEPCWVHNVNGLTTLADAGQLAEARLAAERRPPPVRLRLPVQEAQVITATTTVTAMDHYLVHVDAGETLSVELNAHDHAYFAVTAVDEAVSYKALLDPASTWHAQIPHSQDYLISVATDVPGTTYALYVGRAAAHSAAVLPPVRLLPSNTTGTHQVTGRLVTGLDNRYIVRVRAGGLLSVKLAAVDHAAGFAVVGVEDARPYKRLYDDTRAWSGVVPKTQDYLIVVSTGSMPASGQEYADYQVTVSVQ